MFMHGGIAHIFGNMLFLWIFGDNIEDRLGHVRYIIFYLVCGVLAGLAHVFTTVVFAGRARASLLIPSLGASGAISGVLGGYLLLFPTRQGDGYYLVVCHRGAGLHRYWTLVRLPDHQRSRHAGSAAQAGGVAYGAHIGGFIAGLVLIKIFTIGRSSRRSIFRRVAAVISNER